MSSPTAGGPPGTTFGGMIRVMRQHSDAVSQGFPAIVSAIGPFCKINQAANTSSLTSLANLAAVTGWVAPKAGSVVGVSCSRNTVNVAGTWTVRVKKNDVALFTPTAVTARSVQYFQSNLQSFTYAAGDRLTIKMVTNASYASTTGDFAAFLHVV